MRLPLHDGLVKTWACDPDCAALADRHYSRQTPGSVHFIGNGRKLTLRDDAGRGAVPRPLSRGGPRRDD